MITTVHRTTIVARCPNGPHDVYEVEFIVVDNFVSVERIQELIDDSVRQPIYQEKLTQHLADHLGCRVVTKGRHRNFETECVATPEDSE